MNERLARAGSISELTCEQRLAAGTATQHIFIEAGPGTGKTTVSAQRFGAQRFNPAHRADVRAVVAVSFTRAATRTLHHRVRRLWGDAATAWPHRVVTLDTLMSDLLHDLLRSGLLTWPGAPQTGTAGQGELDVQDSWAVFMPKERTRTGYSVGIAGRQVIPRISHRGAYDYIFPGTKVVPMLASGVCTHQDVRDTLELALGIPECLDRVRARLATTTRALIVDEVFDANDLDLALIDVAVEAGVDLTLVGDPWQALYLFRGARPDLIPAFLARRGVRILQLTQSFRWRTDEQRQLALALRSGEPAAVPLASAGEGLAGLDVVLSTEWKPLWELGPGVLPLAFSGFKGGYEEAAATLLLNHVTRAVLGLDAAFLNDALTALDLRDRDVTRQLEPALQGVTETLAEGTKEAVTDGYLQLVAVCRGVTRRPFRPPHWRHTDRLKVLQSRLACPDRLIPGLTVHQTKGGEWDVVGLRLKDTERSALQTGLILERDMHRKLYVAATRARSRTVEVEPPAS